MNFLSLTHEVLRTSFITTKSGELRQIVLKKRNLECTIERTGKHVEELLREDIQRGFDLQKDSLLRLKIVGIGEN